jgi:hypothetical protein
MEAISLQYAVFSAAAFQADIRSGRQADIDMAVFLPYT